jgi:hypothetical protein
MESPRVAQMEEEPPQAPVSSLKPVDTGFHAYWFLASAIGMDFIVWQVFPALEMPLNLREGDFLGALVCFSSTINRTRLFKTSLVL